MKIFRVRIKSAKLQSYWYAKHIGSEFNCEPIGTYWNYDFGLKVIFEGEFTTDANTCYIALSDVEILEEFEGHVAEKRIVMVVRHESQ